MPFLSTSSEAILQIIGKPAAVQQWNCLFREPPDSPRRSSRPTPFHPYTEFIISAFIHDGVAEKLGVNFSLYQDPLKQELQLDDTIANALESNNGDPYQAENNTLTQRYHLPLRFKFYNKVLPYFAFFSQKHQLLLKNFFPSYESNVNCIYGHYFSESFKNFPKEVEKDLEKTSKEKIKRFGLISIFYVLAIIHEEASKKKGFSDLRKEFSDFIMSRLELAKQGQGLSTNSNRDLTPENLKKSIQKLHVDDGFTWFFLMKLSAFEIFTLMTSPDLLENVNKAAEISKIVNDFYSINKDLKQVIHPLKVFRDHPLSPFYFSIYLFRLWKFQETFNDLQNQRLSLETVQEIINELSPSSHNEKVSNFLQHSFLGLSFFIYFYFNNVFSLLAPFTVFTHLIFQKTIEEELIKLNLLYETMTQHPNRQVEISDTNSESNSRTLSQFIESIDFHGQSEKLTLNAGQSQKDSYWPKEHTGQNDTSMNQYQLQVLRKLKNEIWKTNKNQKILPWATVIQKWYTSQLDLNERYGPMHFNHNLWLYFLLHVSHVLAYLYLGNLFSTSVSEMIHSQDTHSCPISSCNITNQNISQFP